MAATLKLDIVTPRGQVYSNEVDMVTLPGREGEMGILPQHAPLITLIGDGEIVARRGAAGGSHPHHHRLRRDHRRPRRDPHGVRHRREGD